MKLTEKIMLLMFVMLIVLSPSLDAETHDIEESPAAATASGGSEAVFDPDDSSTWNAETDMNKITSENLNNANPDDIRRLTLDQARIYFKSNKYLSNPPTLNEILLANKIPDLAGLDENSLRNVPPDTEVKLTEGGSLVVGDVTIYLNGNNIEYGESGFMYQGTEIVKGEVHLDEYGITVKEDEAILKRDGATYKIRTGFKPLQFRAAGPCDADNSCIFFEGSSPNINLIEGTNLEIIADLEVIDPNYFPLKVKVESSSVSVSGIANQIVKGEISKQCKGTITDGKPNCFQLAFDGDVHGGNLPPKYIFDIPESDHTNLVMSLNDRLFNCIQSDLICNSVHNPTNPSQPTPGGGSSTINPSDGSFRTDDGRSGYISLNPNEYGQQYWIDENGNYRPGRKPKLMITKDMLALLEGNQSIDLTASYVNPYAPSNSVLFDDRSSAMLDVLFDMAAKELILGDGTGLSGLDFADLILGFI